MINLTDFFFVLIKNKNDLFLILIETGEVIKLRNIIPVLGIEDDHDLFFIVDNGSAIGSIENFSVDKEEMGRGHVLIFPQEKVVHVLEKNLKIGEIFRHFFPLQRRKRKRTVPDTVFMSHDGNKSVRVRLDQSENSLERRKKNFINLFHFLD